MAIYLYQNLYHLWFLLLVFILFKQKASILAIAPIPQYPSTDVSDSRSIPTTTISYNQHNDESIDEGEMENNGGDIYDDEDFSDIDSPSTTVSQSRFDENNITSDITEYDDEMSAYPNDNDDDDDDDEQTHIYGDTMSVNRPEFHRPTMDSNNKNSIDSQSTSRMPFDSSNHWRDLLSKPGIVVGIIGGIVIGTVSAILLVMFLIYRMRKKDEGSYALEEAPRKSPSHAYTRVSSREFFA